MPALAGVHGRGSRVTCHDSSNLARCDGYCAICGRSPGSNGSGGSCRCCSFAYSWPNSAGCSRTQWSRRSSTHSSDAAEPTPPALPLPSTCNGTSHRARRRTRRCSSRARTRQYFSGARRDICGVQGLADHAASEHGLPGGPRDPRPVIALPARMEVPRQVWPREWREGGRAAAHAGFVLGTSGDELEVLQHRLAHRYWLLTEFLNVVTSDWRGGTCSGHAPTSPPPARGTVRHRGERKAGRAR
jgi:hypothetical protein